ncbi:MAG: Holliday junction branch migration protein RuvA [Methylococcaceae bacterium]|jgi:holliday junction DNA helicase RuvA|nr:Holliday junction branch migration protein RuvA [Methylococcaceae bacterium]
MIGFLKGKLVLKSPPFLALEVNGVGYEVEAPMTTFYGLPAIGEEILLYTHLAIREDAHILYGFSTERDRLLFRTLVKVNGVGAKLALTILSGLSVEQFQQCIQDNDVPSLVRLPGIGKKTAERLIIEMRDRLSAIGSVNISPAPDSDVHQPSSNPKQEATSALIALGYKPQDASRMIQAVSGDTLSCEEIIRHALQGAVR